MGAISGLGFGLTAGIVHLIIGNILIIVMGMAPMTLFSATTLPIETLVAITVGLLTSPLFLLKKGHLIHPAIMALVWIALERLVAVNPARVAMWAMPSIFALLIYYSFKKLWQKSRITVVAAACILPVAILLCPVLRFYSIGGYDAANSVKAKKAPSGMPDVVFVVMDTVRAQNVSSYGYQRKTTPFFDNFAKEGTLFENATSPGTWSLAAHASLFTGTLPSVHGAHGESNYLDGSIPTLAQFMSEAGFDTQCFTANAYISSGYGLTRGFKSTDKAWQSGEGARGFVFIYRLMDVIGFMPEDKGGSKVANNVRNWMANRPVNGPPAFVFVNFLEAHFPAHQLPSRFRNAYTDETLSTLREYSQMAFGAQIGRHLSASELNRIDQPLHDLYDGGISYTDYLLGEIIDIWKARGTLDNTVFVVLGDHGEHVGEHKMHGHMLSMYQEDLSVPFMFRYPPRIAAGKRVPQPVSTLGTFATLVDLLDMTPPQSVQWDSLAPIMNADDNAPHPELGQPVISERYEKKLVSSRFTPGALNGEGPLLTPWGRYRAFRMDRYKYIRHFQNGSENTFLFDLEQDPHELVDLANKPEYASTLREIEQSYESWNQQLKLPGLGMKPSPVSSAHYPSSIAHHTVSQPSKAPISAP